MVAIERRVADTLLARLRLPARFPPSLLRLLLLLCLHLSLAEYHRSIRETPFGANPSYSLFNLALSRTNASNSLGNPGSAEPSLSVKVHVWILEEEVR